MAAIEKEKKCDFFHFQDNFDYGHFRYKVDIIDFFYCFVFADNFTIKTGGLLFLCIYYFCTDKTKITKKIIFYLEKSGLSVSTSSKPSPF